MERDTSTYKELIFLGKWTLESLDGIIRESTKINDVGLRIGSLSTHFLGTPYQESSLLGDSNTPEAFVINLGGVDCYTFIEYLESMRSSSSFYEFKENLKQVRYREGKVSFENRNHFLTDWSEFNATLIDDVTEQIGGNKIIGVKKMLNMREDKTYFLPGVKPKQRLVKYIPVDAIDESIINKLKTGDYVGIYSRKQGLDVSHVGIFIKERDKILRHASSFEEHRKVVDQNFKDYIAEKPGIIVFRSKPR